MNNKEKIILFLGNADSESSTAKLKATNRLYKRKMLESGVDNWLSIIEYFENYNVDCVVVKLTKNSFNAFASKGYSEVSNRLLGKISQVPNLILAHESLLTGVQTRFYEPQKPTEIDFEDPHFEDFLGYEEYEFNERYSPLDEGIVTHVVDILRGFSLGVTPYSKNVEMSILASSFVEQNENNLIFRIYVPSERIWAAEAEKLLQLFREYLQKASDLNARHDQYKTNNGVIHEFFGDDETAATSMSEKFKEFSLFMDTCAANPELAEKSLISSSLNRREVFDLVAKYSKEAKRLHIDLKHERERKLLNIRHSLESELSEFIIDSSEWDTLYQLVEENIPPIAGVSSALVHKTSNELSTIPKQNVFINSQVFETFNGVLAKEISGTVNLVPDAKKLLETIEEYAKEADKSDLSSAVHELTDPNVKKTDRITAKHKLKAFVISVGSKVGDVATGVFQTFLESQIGL